MKYKITFRTGTLKGSGTDADVSIQIFGSISTSHALELNSTLVQFEKGSTDSFYFNAENLGTIENVKIWHNNKLLGSNWFLNDIIIESAENSELFYFPVFKWIKKDKKILSKSTKWSYYNIEITTGVLPGSGTDRDVELSIVGSKSYTPFIGLKTFIKRVFITGHTEVFTILLEDVGKIQELKLKADSSSFNWNWYLSKLAIKKQIDKNFIYFPFHDWIKSGNTYSLSKDVSEYTIKFYTGEVAAGGTDANVSMIIYGSKTESKPIKLNELIAKNAFESGNIDYIKLSHKSLGHIKKVKIWHDEKWLGDGWFLNKISIKNDNTGVEVEFPYFSWLDKSANPHSTSIELNRMPLQQRPFYAIAHMVNTPAYVEEALDMGSNAVEFDITPILGSDGNYSFDVFHGFRPDLDPDKINLMERSIARTELNEFLQNLKPLEEKYTHFTLAIFDCKLNDVPKNKLELCGSQFADIIFKHFYNEKEINRIYSIISIAKKKSKSFFNGFVNSIPKEFKDYIGFDLSMEKFQTTEKIFEDQKGQNFWWGSGIASTVPKPLKHFIPQFLIAAKKRTKRGVIKKIYYWTLDDPDSMARILVTKLDGIIVNDPSKLLKVLDKEEFRHTYRLATRNDNPFSIF